MRRFHSGLAVGALLCATAPALAQFDEVQIEAIPAAGNIHMLTGRGGNLAVCVGEDGTFLVDDQFAPLTEKIVAKVQELGGGDIRFVLNTHWHGDHTGGNENLGSRGSVVVAHDNVRQRMSVEHFNEVFNRTTPPSPAGALPVVTFSSELRFHLNGEEVHVFHVANAHTDGDAIVHFVRADVIHLGDVWFNGMYPFIDGSSGGSIDGVIAAVTAVLAMVGPETRIIPGHGDLGDRSGLAGYLEMLKGVRNAIAAGLAEHDSVDELVAADPLAAFNAEWGGGFINPEQMVRIVADQLSR